MFFVVVAALTLTFGVAADPFPPNWGGGSGPAVHHAPAPWPADDGDGLLDFGDWLPYRFSGDDSQDQAVQDPSNGGTSPQNYVNVSSGCTDLSVPSTFLYFDDVNEVLMFRWRVEQIPFTYGTGAQTQPASNVDPWKSALWTVLMDIDADGYREFAVHLDGQSGLPGAKVDRLFFIYSDTDTNSIDYVEDPDICLLGHNPTAFTDGPSGNNTGNILNFQNSLNPTSVWSGGGTGRTVFDYGTTRGRALNQDSDGDGTAECVEYFVDYQIPLAALDATSSSCGGPAIDLNTPMCLAFATANSLNNPVQKDIVFEGELCADGASPVPTGDCFTLAAGDVSFLDQPIVNSITAAGCGPATLAASLSDAVGSDGCGLPLSSSIASVDFYSYRDENANGAPDDGNAWTFAAAGTEDAVGEWSASWDSTLLASGLYLIGVRAEDDQGHVTWSYLTEAEVIAQEGSIDPSFANPSPTPGVVYEPLINSCGTSPSITKTVADSEVSAGAVTEFTLTVTASLADPLTVTRLDDVLPAGWSYVATTGGSLAPDCGAAPDDCPGGATYPNTTDTISWAISAAALPAGTSGTLTFQAQAPTVQGTYTNSATAATSAGALAADPVQISVGAPRLTLAKDADVLSTTPGGTVVYTITYSNDSPVATTDTVITDQLPLGLSFDSTTGGGVYDVNTGTVTWSVGTLFPGDGPFSVTVTATVDDPLPAGAAVPILNTAVIDSNETTPATNDAAVFVNLPLRIQKSASTDIVAPGGSVTFTLDYANTGTATATGATLTDPVPTGFTFVSATGGGVHDGATPGTVTWSLGSLAAGASGSVQVTLTASSPFSGDTVSTNTGTLSATGLSSVSDSYEVGVTGQCVSTTYYMKNQTGDVGAAGIRNLATPIFPTAATPTQLPAGGLILDNDPGSPTPQSGVMSRFYSDPSVGPGGIIVDDVTATVFITKNNGTKTEFTLVLYDYDPSTGSQSLLGTQTQATSGGSGGTFQLSFTYAIGGTAVAEDHRLLWILSGNNTSTGGTKIVTVSHLFDATNDSLPAITNWESQSTACLSSYASTLNKSVDALSVLPGGTLQYTLEFSNPGAGVLTGATLVDVLPDGVSYVSSTLNGAAASPSISGQELTFTVAGAGDPAGTLSSGNSGVLVINVSVDDPLGADTTALVNDATLTTTEAPEEIAEASTVVRRPNLVIAKAVDDTLLIPGDVATYTLTLTNAGTVAATSVTVSDDIPDESYFVFGACTVDDSAAPSATTTTCGESGGVLTGTANQLGIGETLIFTFTMSVTLSPLPPDGLTSLDNTATATSATDATVSSSETVTVTVSTNPNLQITKSQSPASGPLAAGDTLTYTLSVSNTGSADALGVVVVDPVPAETTYQAGTLTYEAAAQSDAIDGDAGSFNAVANRTEWNIATLSPGVTRTMTLDVVLDSVLANGTTVISNLATVSSSNAGLKQASTSIDAEAAPDFSALSKSAPDSMASPLTLTSAASTASTTVAVDDVTLLSVFDYVHIGGTSARITDITGTTLTLDTAVTAAAGSVVEPVIPFLVQYRNDGTATATSVVVSDDLPASTVFVAADSGGVHDGATPGTVSWTLGAVAPGDSGTLRFWARPTTTGTFTNTAFLSSAELADQSSNTTTTDIGVLEPSKSTSTPSLTNTNSGTSATYTIAVTNNSGATATNVQFTDTMEAGFTYASTTTIDFLPNNGVATRTSTVDPVAGENPATWCCWSLDAGGTIQITFVADVDSSVGDGTYQNDLDVSSDNVAALDFDPLATIDEDVTVDFTGPNHVVITDFSASLDERGRVVVEWQTDAETGTLGFRLLRLEKDGLVPASGVLPSTLAPQGSRYRVVDWAAPPDRPSSYVLVEIENDGRTPSYGPFHVDPLASPRRPDPADGEMIELGRGYSAAPRAQLPRSGAHRPSKASIRRPPWLEDDGDALRLGIVESGLYRLGVDEIAGALGLELTQAQQLVRTGRLRLTADGVPVPTLTTVQGTEIGFYGEARETLYSRERIYRLEVERGARLESVSGAPGGAAGDVFLDEKGFHEDAIHFLFAGPETGDELWFWDLAASVAGLERLTFELETPGVSIGGSLTEASLRVGVQGLAGAGVENALRVSLNGVVVGERFFGATEGFEGAFPFDASLLEEINEVSVEALTPGAGGTSVFAIDRFDLAWPRDYDARGAAAFAFGGEDHDKVAVRRFASSQVVVLDVTDGASPRLVRDVAVTPDASGGYRLELSPDAPGRHYLAVSPAGLLAPASIEVDYPSDLRTSSAGADWVAIAPEAFLEGAEQLAAHRRSQGLETRVVDLADVMDEFNHGHLDPFAIRDFLAHAAESWQPAPRYVLLVGEGTFDYKDVWGHGTNLLPPVMVGGESGLFPSDLLLGDLEGDDGVPEVVVGRVPVLTADELEAWIAKLIAHETAAVEGWMNDLLFVADNPDSTGNYPLEANLLAAQVPAGFDVFQTTLGPQTAAQVRADLLAALGGGTGLVSILGHAGLTTVFHEAVLTTGDVPSLANGERLAVVSAMSCYLGNYAYPGFDTMAEALMLHAGGGAAAVLAPSGLSYNVQRRELGEAFQRAVLLEGQSVLGDALLYALETGRVSRETLRSQVLLGDPGQRLRVVGQ